MKSRHFLLAALVALVTFSALRVAAHHRRWQGRGPWSHGNPRGFFNRGHWGCADAADPAFGRASQPGSRPADVAPPATVGPLSPASSVAAPTPADTAATQPRQR